MTSPSTTTSGWSSSPVRAERFFCTGTDLKLTPPPAESFAATLLNDRGIRLTPPTTFAKPVIAAINGMAIGGGLEIALASDQRIAADTAQFGLSEVKVGSLAGQGGTQRLPRAIPQAMAMKMLLTGDRIDAVEALRIGLVSDVYPPSSLREQALRLAARICQAAPLSVRAAKMAAIRGAGLPLDAGLELENQLWGSLRDTEDRREGRTAFAENGHRDGWGNKAISCGGSRACALRGRAPDGRSGSSANARVGGASAHQRGIVHYGHSDVLSGCSK